MTRYRSKKIFPTFAVLKTVLAVLALLVFCACSSTSNLGEEEILYVGMKKTNYTDAQESDHFVAVQEEVEAALACAPNGAFMGSSYLVTPFPIRLWIYNKYYNSRSGFGRWMRNSFGAEPVLMETVNPLVRSSVAQNVLRNNGYFQASVDYKTIPMKNPKKEKVAYTVTAGKLYVIDTLKYVRFTPEMDSIINANMSDAVRLKNGDPFSISRLDAERTRIASLLRNNGYYYYNAAYSTFIADSVSNPGHIEVHLEPLANIPPEATRKWHLGKMNITMRKANNEPVSDTIDHRYLSIAYAGKKVPIRPRAILRDLKVRPRQLYNQDNINESSDILNSMGLFSMANFTLTPRDTTANCDTLDLNLNMTFDKPYDVSFEANYKIKSNDRTGPGMVLSLSKRNVFRGGEKLTLNLRGSYEWHTGKRVGGSNSQYNSYEYGGDITLEYPRLEVPFEKLRQRRFYAPPSTTFTIKSDVYNHADYYNMLALGGSVTYKFRTSETSSHEFSPFVLDYNYMYSYTDKFNEMTQQYPAVLLSLSDQFVPKMKYTYTYTSPKSYRHPIKWETTITEAGNFLTLAYMATGKKFSEKYKDLFNNPYAQFVKVNTDLCKTWTLSNRSKLVGHVAAGVLVPYGNSEFSPYLEQFYVGGANSIRAFSIRSLGPGTYTAPPTAFANLDQTGDFKLEFNLEYRFNITGGLYGAAFLDAGNIWLLKKNEDYPGAEFKMKNFFDQLATGTGLGIRYDLDFFVLRFDVGCAIHAPYDTGKSGYYNIPKFSNGLTYHFAIGYPF